MGQLVYLTRNPLHDLMNMGLKDDSIPIWRYGEIKDIKPRIGWTGPQNDVWLGEILPQKMFYANFVHMTAF